MQFRFLEVENKYLLDEVFAFRYKILKKSDIYKDYFLETDFDDYKEYDKFDPFAIHFAALNQDSEVCATVRLIHNCPLGYPTENDMEFNNTLFERDKLGEMSRIFVDAKYRNIKTTKIIVEELKKLLYYKMMDLGIEYTYGALEPRFVRLLKMYNMNYEIIGKKQFQGKMGLRFPCILYTKRLGEDNPEFIKERIK